ncbi:MULTISPECIES: hypothetical protein [unclassified Paenibacillus]|uniref:hypothetical protein n=1 Tax=unclassified Paenibacillus TaxID=185978 RepID=UPI001AE7D1BF|nr:MULTISPECIES: hypothetical protein [unclassified Paenibacillus]MBP1155364.1 hypothetical protein [Paenibacillus sp. PvP091]MBP1169252.1 hypothetical protein [Paenibacillus sp. PvR098]MBP2440279.1 hypothetical protein [Paenibacillus sp. PvP052]
MKKSAVIVLLSMLSVSICSSAFAEPSKLNNTNEWNMDFPAAGVFEAFKSKEDTLVTEFKFEWSEAQINLLHRTLPNAYIPSFVLQDSEFDGLQPVGVISSLPGVKVEKLDSNEDGVDDQIRLYVTDPSSLDPDRKYEISTVWRYQGAGNPSVRMSSFLSHPQPLNGMILDLSGTKDTLLSISWNQVKERKEMDQNQTQLQTADRNAMYYAKMNWTNNVAKDSGRLSANFLKVQSPEQLKQYRAEQKNRLDVVPDESFQRFAVTYSKPRFLTFEQLYENEDYLVTQVYQVGKDVNDKEITIVSFDQEHHIPVELLREKRISNYAVTEWEGITFRSAIKELERTAYSVNMANQNNRPTGIYWLKDKYDKMSK